MSFTNEQLAESLSSGDSMTAEPQDDHLDGIAQALTEGVRSGHGTILCAPNGKPILTCRGEILSGGYDGRPYNIRFTEKQCKKMLGALYSEMTGGKVKVIDVV